MSRIGALPVKIAEGVKVDVEGLKVSVSGPKGSISKTFIGNIAIECKEKILTVSATDASKSARAMWGTARSIINSMVIGVVSGFSEVLELVGVGYKFALKGGYIDLSLGKSHNTKIAIPSNINVTLDSANKITLSSCDKEFLGMFCSTIMREKKVEPYKGKGIIKVGQYVHRKETKKG
jgi:large subunit ribosomal protein L6